MTLNNPFTFLSDQEIVSPLGINTISSRRVMRRKKKYQLGDYWLIQCQILQTDTIRIVWQAVRSICDEILEVKGLIVGLFIYLVLF